jgi:hypothetical protein
MLMRIRSMWSKRFPWLVQLLLLGLFALGGLLRLIDLTDPPLDFHPTRQLRSAIFAREIYYRMLPDIDPDLRATAIAHANTIERYEPRLLETIVAVTYRVIGAETLWVARLYTTLFWLVGGLALFALARRMTSPEGGLVAVGYYLLLPFGVQASRSFQPDPFMVMWFILSIYFLYRWTQERTWRWAILAGVSGGLGVLVKVVIAYLVAGAALAAVLTTTGLRRALRDLQVWAMALLMIVPPTIYYIFIKDPGSTAEYVSSWTLALLRLIIAPDFYVRWMSFLHTLLGLTPIFLGLAGVIISRPQNRAILLGMWIGYGLIRVIATLPDVHPQLLSPATDPDRGALAGTGSACYPGKDCGTAAHLANRHRAVRAAGSGVPLLGGALDLDGCRLSRRIRVLGICGGIRAARWPRHRADARLWLPADVFWWVASLALADHRRAGTGEPARPGARICRALRQPDRRPRLLPGHRHRAIEPAG